MSSAQTNSQTSPRTDDEQRAVVAAAQAGDETAFSGLVQRHRRELHVHCYRMVGSFDEAEDLVQETFLRAWRKRESYAGRATFRAWLYRIATNACLDALARRKSRQVGVDGPATAEVTWLQPYPDRLLDEIAATDDAPDAVVVARETIELAFLAAVQLLPAHQRAVLILRDVLGWPAADTAALLDRSVASVNSALQRARATLRERLPERRLDWRGASDPTDAERAVVERFIAATEAADMTGLAALLREDARHTMPPEPLWFQGRERIIAEWGPVLAGPDAWGEWRLVPTRANRQPAVANYLRRPGEEAFAAVALDVLRVEGGLVTEVTTFPPDCFPAFGLDRVWRPLVTGDG